jgi:hypothetical protein
VRFALEGTRSNRDAIGVKIEVMAGDKTIYRQRKGGYSMQGTNDPRVTIGIGTAPEIKKAVIRWPSGAVQVLENVKVDREHKIVEPRTVNPAGPSEPAQKTKGAS